MPSALPRVAFKSRHAYGRHATHYFLRALLCIGGRCVDSTRLSCSPFRPQILSGRLGGEYTQTGLRETPPALRRGPDATRTLILICRSRDFFNQFLIIFFNTLCQHHWCYFPCHRCAWRARHFGRAAACTSTTPALRPDSDCHAYMIQWVNRLAAIPSAIAGRQCDRRRSCVASQVLLKDTSWRNG